MHFSASRSSSSVSIRSLLWMNDVAALIGYSRGSTWRGEQGRSSLLSDPVVRIDIKNSFLSAVFAKLCSTAWLQYVSTSAGKIMGKILRNSYIEIFSSLRLERESIL